MNENFRIYFDPSDILCYTVLFTGREPNKRGLYECLCLSNSGSYEHSQAQRGNHLGRIIPYQRLPEICQEVIKQNL